MSVYCHSSFNDLEQLVQIEVPTTKNICENNLHKNTSGTLCSKMIERQADAAVSKPLLTDIFGLVTIKEKK